MDAFSVVERLVAAVERRDLEAFAALYANDAVGRHPLHPEPVRGREAIRASEQALFDSFSDVEIEARSLISDGQRCAASWSSKRGTRGRSMSAARSHFPQLAVSSSFRPHGGSTSATTG